MKFGNDSSQKLLVIPIFCLRRLLLIEEGNGLYQIQVDSITVEKNEKRYRVTYVERRSKNILGLANINKQKKTMKHFDPLNLSGTFTKHYLLYLARSHVDVCTSTGSDYPLFDHPYSSLRSSDRLV